MGSVVLLTHSSFKMALQNAQKSADTLKTISHPLRLSIIGLLSQPGVGQKCVSDIIRELEQPQAIISQHLIHLKDRGILTNTKVGTRIFYSMAKPGLNAVIEHLAKMMGA